MSHIDPGPLATYNSLLDKHLAGYFNNTRMKKHLRKSGLLTRRGHVVSDSTFRLNMAQKEHKKHVRDLLAQAIVHKTLDMERNRQVDIRKKLEEIAKIEVVRRVRAEKGKKREHQILPFFAPRIPKRHFKKAPTNNSWTQMVANSDEEDDEDYKFGPLFAAADGGARAERSRKGDEEVLPYLSPRSQGKKGTGKQRPRSGPNASRGQGGKGKSKQANRPVSAPANESEDLEPQHDHPQYGSHVRQIWVDADGNPVNPDELRHPYVDSDDEQYQAEKQRGNLSDFTDATNSRRSSFSSGSYRSLSPVANKGKKKSTNPPLDKSSPYMENQTRANFSPQRSQRSGFKSTDSTPRTHHHESQPHYDSTSPYLHTNQGPDSPVGQYEQRSHSPPQYPRDQIDSRNLYSLDNTALREYTTQLHHDDQGRVAANPYTRNVFPPHVPSPPKGTPKLSPRGRKSAQSKGQKQPKGKQAETNEEKPKKKNLGTLMLHRTEPAFKLQNQLQSFCEVTMHYHGSNITIEREMLNPYHEVLVEQQHCGGNTLAVFREGILPDTDFTFISRRHRGYPFSLSFYINGVMDVRLSTCCEYKHTVGAKLGGKQGHFSVVSIEGGQKCYKCKLDGEAKERERKRKEKRQEREAAKEKKVQSQMERDRPPRKLKPPRRKEDLEKEKEQNENQKTEEEQEAEFNAFPDSDTEEVDDNAPTEEKEEPILVPVQNSSESEGEADNEDNDYDDDFEEDDNKQDENTNEKDEADNKESPESEPETEVEVEGYQDDFEKDEKSESEEKSDDNDKNVTSKQDDGNESDAPASDVPDSDRSERSVKSDRSERSVKSDRSNRSDKSDRSVKSDKSDATTIVGVVESAPAKEKDSEESPQTEHDAESSHEQEEDKHVSEVEETDIEDEYKKDSDKKKSSSSGTDTETADEVKSEVEKSENSSSEDEDPKEESTTNREDTDNERKDKSDYDESEAEEDGKVHIDKADRDLMKSEVEEICDMLRSESSVKSINLRNCSLDDDDLKNLADALGESHSNPKMINISNNYISSLGAKHIVEIITKKPDIQILMLHGALRDAGVSKVAQGIINYQRQAMFDKTAKHMAKGAIKDAVRSDSMQSLVSMGSTSTQHSEGGRGLGLTELDVGDCNLGPGAAKKIADVIECTKLNMLSLSANKGLGKEGWEDIGKALRDNGTIKKLCLDYCDIGDENMEILSEYLSENSTIESIDLESNNLSDEGAQKVLDAAIGNPSMKDIKMLPGNNFDSEILNDLNEILKMRRDDN